jgi:hypothetical protein
MGGTCFVIIELILGKRQKSKSAKSEVLNIRAISNLTLGNRKCFRVIRSVQKLAGIGFQCASRSGA